MSTESNSPAVRQRDDEWGAGPPTIQCDRCGHTHNLHGDCVGKWDTGGSIPSDPGRCPDCGSLAAGPHSSRPRTEQLPGQPKFNSLHVSHLPQKIDGVTSHLFIAILNGEAVGACLASIHASKSCELTAAYVKHVNRRMGIGTRIVKAIEVWAKRERASHLEVVVMRGNVNARQFWIRQKFIEDDSSPTLLPKFTCMVKPI